MRGPVSQGQARGGWEEAVGERDLGGAASDADAGSHAGAGNIGRGRCGSVAGRRAAVHGHGTSFVAPARPVPHKRDKRGWKFDAVAHADPGPHGGYGPVVPERGRLEFAQFERRRGGLVESGQGAVEPERAEQAGSSEIPGQVGPVRGGYVRVERFRELQARDQTEQSVPEQGAGVGGSAQSARLPDQQFPVQFRQ